MNIYVQGIYRTPRKRNYKGIFRKSRICALIDPKKSLSGDTERGIPSLPDASYLNFIYVRYRMRGRGIGERMLRSIKA